MAYCILNVEARNPQQWGSRQQAVTPQSRNHQLRDEVTRLYATLDQDSPLRAAVAIGREDDDELAGHGLGDFPGEESDDIKYEILSHTFCPPAHNIMAYNQADLTKARNRTSLLQSAAIWSRMRLPSLWTILGKTQSCKRLSCKISNISRLARNCR